MSRGFNSAGYAIFRPVFNFLHYFWLRSFKKQETLRKINHIPLFTHILRLGTLSRSRSESPKVKENVFLLLNSIRARGGGFTRSAQGSSMTESPLLRLSAAVTHFNSTLFLSHWKPSTMTFNKGRRVKTWLFFTYSFPRLGRGPSKGINHCSLTATAFRQWLVPFLCTQKWHINPKMDMHKLYIQLLAVMFVKQPHKCRGPVRMETAFFYESFQDFSLTCTENVQTWFS